MAKKRAPRGGGSIRQRKDGRWEGRFSPGVDPLTGKRRYKSVYGATQAEARKKLAKAVAEVDAGTFRDPSKITVAEWAEEWLRDYKRDLRESSRSLYSLMLRLYALPALGRIRLNSVSTYQVQAVLNAADIEPNSKILLRAALGGMFGDAERTGLITQNPITKTVRPKKPKKEIIILSDDELTRLLAECEKTAYGTLFFFLAFTGVRIGEAVGLTWDRVDLEHGFITIDRQITDRNAKAGLFTPPKTGVARKLRPATAVIDRLRKHRAEQTAAFLETGVRCPLGLVFCSATGDAIRTASVRRALHSASSVIGRTLNPHGFRHNYAAMALRAGDNPRTVQEALGHSSAAFTLEVYAAVNDQMREESAARMDDFMERFSL